MSGWSAADLLAHREQHPDLYGDPVPAKPAAAPAAPKGARQREAAKRGPNKWESEYAEILEGGKRAGVFLWYGFEALTLRLADRTTYRPDFIVVMADGSVEAIEIKGFPRDDAIVKYKVAAEMFPWIKFRMMRKRPVKAGGGWEQIK